PRDTLERGASQAGTNQLPGQPEKETHMASGSAPVTRDELMKFMTSLKGEIKDLITKSRAGPSRGQSAKKTPLKKGKSVRDRQPTPHPKEKAVGTIDWSKILLPKRNTNNPRRTQQPVGSKKLTLDAREIITRKRNQQLSKSASTSNFPDSFNNTSAG